MEDVHHLELLETRSEPRMADTVSSILILPLQSTGKVRDARTEPWCKILEILRNHNGCEGLAWGFQHQEPSKLTIIIGIRTGFLTPQQSCLALKTMNSPCF